MIIKNIKNKKGFSLIEIIVAVFILTIAFISVMYAFPLGLSINKGASNATIASYLAQEKIEELHSQGYENIATGTTETKHRLATSSTSYLYGFQRETTVTYVDGNLAATSTDAGLKEISTTVYYINAYSKEEKDYNITTLISQR